MLEIINFEKEKKEKRITEERSDVDLISAYNKTNIYLFSFNLTHIFYLISFLLIQFL
jgi:hypothetical protein